MIGLRIGVLILAGFASAQTRPVFDGVWRFNPEASKITGRPPGNVLMRIAPADGRIVQKLLVIERSGREDRMEFLFDTSRETANNMRGVPVKSSARWEGDTLLVESSFRVPNPPMDVRLSERWSLSADRLTIQRITSRNGSDSTETMVFDRGSPDDMAALNRPEKTAGENYRNIQVLKSLPSSKLVGETMMQFQTALGVRCDHCHVPNEWDRDDKPAKVTARRMLLMTEAINRDHLKGAGTVQCQTCHRGRQKPE